MISFWRHVLMANRSHPKMVTLRGVVGAIFGWDDLAVPYFWKGAKWSPRLHFLTKECPGFLEAGRIS
jgi:hypothetical protein